MIATAISLHNGVVELCNISVRCHLNVDLKVICKDVLIRNTKTIKIWILLLKLKRYENNVHDSSIGTKISSIYESPVSNKKILPKSL